MGDVVVPVRRIREEAILTGEAVELEVRPASPLLRVAAGIVDGMVVLLSLFVGAVLLSRTIAPPSDTMARVWIISTLALAWLVLPVTVETATRGRSLGKWAFSMRVVRQDGGVITARHALVRAMVGLVELWVTLGSVALLTSLVTPRSQRLGDLAAGTMVVRMPEPVRWPPLLMPPDLAAWAATAQILPVGTQLQAEALGFLRSNREMAPDVRERAATSLARRVLVHVAPPPPEGTHPERFLAAVLVVTRDREYAREVARLASGRVRRLRASGAPFGI